MISEGHRAVVLRDGPRTAAQLCLQSPGGLNMPQVVREPEGSACPVPRLREEEWLPPNPTPGNSWSRTKVGVRHGI